MAEQPIGLRLLPPAGPASPSGSEPASPALAQQILTRAAEAADAPALAHAETVTSFGTLAEQAEGLGQQLCRLRIGADEPVIVVAHKSVLTVSLILACLMQRRPFLLMSPQLPAAQADLLARQSGCRWTLGGAATDRLQAERTAAAVASDRPTLDGVSFMLTTSGSTGVPKVVPVGHEQLDRFVSWAARRLALGPDTVTLNLAPLNFDLCLLDVWAALAAGGSAVLIDPERAVFGRHLLTQAERYEPTLIQSVPMFLTLMLSARTAHDRLDQPVSSAAVGPARRVHRRSDPRGHAARAAVAVPAGPVPERLRVHRDQRHVRGDDPRPLDGPVSAAARVADRRCGVPGARHGRRYGAG